MKRSLRSPPTLVVALMMMLVAMVPRSSRADADAERTAQQFFDRGIKARDEGKCQVIPVGDAAKCRESVDAFRRAYALNPSGLGALRNLAYVERSLGLVTSAAHHFNELARKAPLDPKPERQQWAKFANEEAKALEPRAPHLVVKVPRDRPADLKVYLDEEPFAEASWGASVDVDPGTHAIRAESPKVPTFAVSIDVAERETRTIDVIFPVPTIVQPAVQVVTIAPATEEPLPQAAPVVPENRAEPVARKINVAPLVVTGIGALALGAGFIAGIAAGDERDRACDSSTKLCEPGGLDSARSLATASTVLTVVGAVVVVGGLVWFVVHPSSASARSAHTAQLPRFDPFLSPRGGGVIGTF